MHYFKLILGIKMVKDLFQANQSRNEKMESWVNDLLSDFKNDEKIKMIKNPNKIIGIVEKILDLNKEKRRGLKILTPMQMLQILPVALAEVKAGNESENLLNEIYQIIQSWCWAEEISKIVYNSIMNSITS